MQSYQIVQKEWMQDVLTRVASSPINKIQNLIPQNWKKKLTIKEYLDSNFLKGISWGLTEQTLFFKRLGLFIEIMQIKNPY